MICLFSIAGAGRTAFALPAAVCSPSCVLASSQTFSRTISSRATSAFALLWDVVVTPLLLPVMMLLFERTRPAELAF